MKPFVRTPYPAGARRSPLTAAQKFSRDAEKQKIAVDAAALRARQEAIRKAKLAEDAAHSRAGKGGR